MRDSGIGSTDLLWHEFNNMFTSIPRHIHRELNAEINKPWETMTVNIPSTTIAVESFRIFHTNTHTIIEIKAAGLNKDTISITLNPITVGGQRSVTFRGKYKQLDPEAKTNYADFPDLEMKIVISLLAKDEAIATYVDGVIRAEFILQDENEVKSKGINIPIT